jgi:hypothetical protein
MATTGQHVYYVRRLVSGATGTNTINVYHAPKIEGEWEPEEPHGVGGEIAIEVEDHLVEGGAEVEVENYEVAGYADVPEPAEPVIRHVIAVEPELALQGHAALEDREVVEPPAEPDTAAIAEAMKQAALHGVPFCEECMRARLRKAKAAQPKPAEDVDAKAMAEAMKEAARQGVPFCEQCTRARLKRQRDRMRA